jgi:hypothetical protein
MRAGFLFRWESFWIGVHYSRFEKRFCINFVPFVTLWITLEGGNIPYSVAQKVADRKAVAELQQRMDSPRLEIARKWRKLDDIG